MDRKDELPVSEGAYAEVSQGKGVPGKLAGETPGFLDYVVLALAVVPLFLNLGGLSLWGSENRWLEIANHMRQTGDWLEPKLSGEFYGDKPLLSYWVIVVASWLLGPIDDLVIRIPSATAGAITVFVTGWMAARLFGRRLAGLAGCLLSASFSFFFWSRSASADLLSLALATSAAAIYIEASLGFRRWHSFVYFALLALGGQSKGMPAVIPPLVVASLDVLLGRRREILTQWRWIGAGGALGSVFYAVPFVLSFLSRGDWKLLEFLWQENFVRAFAAYDHTANPLYYFYTFPAMFLPWTLWLPGGLIHAARNFRLNPSCRFVLGSFVAIFLLFTASESRRSYYILPIFPYAALLVAAAWNDRLCPGSVGSSTRVERLLTDLPVVLLSTSFAAGALFLLATPFLGRFVGDLATHLPAAIPCALVFLSCVAFTLFFWLRRGHRMAFPLLVVTSILVMSYSATAVDSFREHCAVERSFAAEIRREYPTGDIIFFQRSSSKLRHYLGGSQLANTEKDLLAHLAADQPELLVVSDRAGQKDLIQLQFLKCEELLQASTPDLGLMRRTEIRYFLHRVSKS